MNAAELVERVVAYGADKDEINDRFSGNCELYETCFLSFLSEDNAALLERAIKQKDYPRAFEAAHALKGVAANLGIKSYYAAICTLVESLRAKSYDNIGSEYQAVEEQYKILKALADENAPEIKPEESAINRRDTLKHTDKNADTPDGGEEKSKRYKFIVTALVSIAAVFIVSFLSLSAIRSNYLEKTRYESGRHLIETGRQIGLYLEEEIANDWRIAESIEKSIERAEQADDEEILALLKEQQQIWDTADLMLYTENGYCVYADGNTAPNGTASQTLADTYKYGSNMSIIDSKITYTVPINTAHTFNGSKIVAVSVVRSMETFIDELDLSAYENEAWIYLTDEDGIIISMLTKNDAVHIFNIKNLFKTGELTPISEEDASADIFSVDSPEAYYAENPSGDKYAVALPVSTDETTSIRMRLYYIVPSEAVNEKMDVFSQKLTAFSALIIGLLVGLTAITFLALYKSRKRRFDAEIMAREHMFDLLIQNIRTVFGLFDAEENAPLYVSDNASKILGEKYWTFEKTREGYAAHTASGEESELIKQANALLKNWDGKSVFRSGYLQGGSAFKPEYFEMILYPADENSRDIVGIIQDVTAAYEREEATKNALEMAKRSDKAKTRFLANMSHDIRTPMNAIMNMALLALENADRPKKNAEYLSTIYASSKHLLYLINDVLDMSRIESGQTVIASEPFNIKNELQKQADAIKTLCEAKHQTFIVSLDGIKTASVLGDSLKVSQIVMNLLSNANKFTQNGGAVRFTAEQIPSIREELVNIRITVEDNGIGISKENRKDIFEPFAQVRDKRVGETEGTGLGLSICKSYTEAMGGSITCESEEGEGSKFTVELVFEKADAVKEEKTEPDMQSNTPFRGMRCLVAEDISTNRTIAKILLERMGFTVDMANDGSEAVREFLKSPPGKYDVIYMDIQMPVIDGYQAAVRIRESEHPQAKTIPILAMSANVFVEDIENARISGMNGYIGKPIVAMDLIEQTVKALETKKGKEQ